MQNSNLTVLIHSCHKFSDLWAAHIQLLNRNWPDRSCRTILLTDSTEDIEFNNVEIISAGQGLEITDRIRYVLPLIETEYVLVTLDDYFPIYPLSTAKIERLIAIMERNSYDYIRLYREPKCKLFPTVDKDIYTYTLDGEYKVNLYSGIWRKSFIEKTLSSQSLTAWEYEVSLTPNAAKLNAKCAMSKGREFPIMDVVRKGKLLRPAARYLTKNKLYFGSRPVMSISEVLKLSIKTSGQRILRLAPKPIFNSIRTLLMKFGMHSYGGNNIKSV